MASRDVRTRLRRRATKAGVFLSDTLAQRLVAYHELLSRWNKKINLTSLEDLDESIDRLLIEPMVATRYLPGPDIHLIDIGSGGGSPAIPMRLALPELRLTMVEAKARKAVFLREAVRSLSLTGTAVEAARYEELLAHPDLHEAFGAVSVRAVKIEGRVLQTLQAFLAPVGVMLLFRGPGGAEQPSGVIPPLAWTATVPLVDTLQSRLTILTKRSIGYGFDVSRGTSSPR